METVILFDFMKRKHRYFFKKVIPARIRNAMAFRAGIRGSIDRPACLEKPEGSAVLVLSPHPDDDVTGCGGVLHKHHLAGDRIVAVYMTDGRKGGSGAEPEEQVAGNRRKEAENAAEIIGIDHLVFLDNKDSMLAPTGKTVGQVAGYLEEVRPDIVYLPSLMDFHEDHIATNDIFVEAIEAAAGKCRDFTCYGYEVWTPLLPNCYVDIGDVIEVKRSALEMFRTQTSRFNLVGASLGLSKYRSVMLFHGDSHVECFYRCSPEAYRTLWESMK